MDKETIDNYIETTELKFNLEMRDTLDILEQEIDLIHQQYHTINLYKRNNQIPKYYKNKETGEYHIEFHNRPKIGFYK